MSVQNISTDPGSKLKLDPGSGCCRLLFVLYVCMCRLAGQCTPGTYGSSPLIQCPDTNIPKM